MLALLAALLVSACSDANPDAVRVKTDWWLSESAAGQEFNVVVFTGSSDCTSFDELVVTESDDTVTIEAFVESAERDECSANYTYQLEHVRLAEPLGGRTLNGCVAPPDGLQAFDLPHDAVECAARVRTDIPALQSDN